MYVCIYQLPYSHIDCILRENHLDPTWKLQFRMQEKDPGGTFMYATHLREYIKYDI